MNEPIVKHSVPQLTWLQSSASTINANSRMKDQPSQSQQLVAQNLSVVPSQLQYVTYPLSDDLLTHVKQARRCRGGKAQGASSHRCYLPEEGGRGRCQHAQPWAIQPREALQLRGSPRLFQASAHRSGDSNKLQEVLRNSVGMGDWDLGQLWMVSWSLFCWCCTDVF